MMRIGVRAGARVEDLCRHVVLGFALPRETRAISCIGNNTNENQNENKLRSKTKPNETTSTGWYNCSVCAKLWSMCEEWVGGGYGEGSAWEGKQVPSNKNATQ